MICRPIKMLRWVFLPKRPASINAGLKGNSQSECILKMHLHISRNFSHSYLLWTICLKIFKYRVGSFPEWDKRLKHIAMGKQLSEDSRKAMKWQTLHYYLHKIITIKICSSNNKNEQIKINLMLPQRVTNFL